MSTTLESGRGYIGEVDPGLLPNGFGKEYYPNGKLLYKGQYKHGLKHGQGIFYHENGLKGYEGEFSKNYVHGEGTMYHHHFEIPQFKGKFLNGTLLKGQLFYENGTLADSI